MLLVVAAATVVAVQGRSRDTRREAEPVVTLPAIPVRPVAAPPPCSLYVDPDGDEDGSGLRSDPLTLEAAAGRTEPGDVVCLLGGEYTLSSPLYIDRSGVEGRPIVYRGEDGPARLRWDSSDQNDMFQVTDGTHHIVIADLSFDGGGVADMAVKCSRGAHHVRVTRTRIVEMGVSGVTGKRCDYLTVDHNLIHRAGYGKGWGSGVSLNLHRWSDREPGFHSFVVNNVISGTVDESDHNSDGNGVIVDLGDETPPALIAGNVIHQNGGRCVHSYHVTDVWIVNNTCYRNTLDTRLVGEGGGVGEFTSFDAQDVHLVNNVAYGWNETHPAFKLQGGSDVTLIRNVEFGGGRSVVPSGSLVDDAGLRRLDPLFAAPPAVDESDERQYRDAAEPIVSDDRFGVRPGSPLIDAGVDPRTVHGVTPALRAGMEEHLGVTVDGARRPRGAGWDIGAYER